MLKNYLTIAFRNLRSKKGYAFINVLGLAIGITVCLLIFLVIRFETSFDNFHSKRDHIYRVVSVFKTSAGIDYEPGVAFPTGPALRLDYPQLKDVASILSLGGGEQINSLDNMNDAHPLKMFKEPYGVFYAEPQFFDIFDFKWLAGDKRTALQDPNTVLLTRSMAEKYFGNWQTAMGRFLKVNNTLLLKITGILNDMPVNTDFPLKVVISYATLKNTWLNYSLPNWTATFAQHYCFVVLPDNLSPNKFNKDLASLVNKYKPEGYKNEGMMLLPLKDMHYDNRYETFHNHVFSKNLLLALSLIGVFILIIACVNFVNLATAQAFIRSKEVGIRKVLGSSRQQLLFQFLSETTLLVLFAAFIAVGLSKLTIPFFNQLLGIGISQTFITDPSVIKALIIIIVGTIFLAGFYPAFVLSGFNPVTAFKNKAAVSSMGTNFLKRLLVVFQFTISQTLIICVLIIISQMNYFKSTPLGFDKDAIVITHIPMGGTGNSKIGSLYNQLLQIPGITRVSFSYASPMDENMWNSDIKYNDVVKNDFGASLKWADANYFSTYHLKLIAGQFYGPCDTIKDFIVNEAFLKKLGIRDPKSALGGKIFILGAEKSGRIIGVVKDFNDVSLQNPISPILMSTWKELYSTVNIKVAGPDVGQTLRHLENLMKTSFPDDVYEYRFLDENITAYYKQEEQLSQLYKIFAGIAISISCLGLYSLVSFMTIQRTKEVGIRKTLGASVGSIVYLFSKEFTWLIILSFVISAPIAWYLMHRWLQNYAYHIIPGPGVFLSAISASIFIASLSIGYKAVSAALSNPVNSLRSE
jgi:putative ABC transport system permease protein